MNRSPKQIKPTQYASSSIYSNQSQAAGVSFLAQRENCTTPERPNCDVLQCRWIFQRPAWRRAERQHCLHPRQGFSCLDPPVKSHDHHSFSPHRLAMSCTRKFTTSSHRRDWFSMLWFPLAELFLHRSITFDVVKSDLMVLKEQKRYNTVRQ